MATTVRLVDVRQRPGLVEVEFADGATLEFPSLEDTVRWATEIDADVSMTRRLCVAFLAARSPTFSNTSSVRNKDFTFDLSAAAPIKVQ